MKQKVAEYIADYLVKTGVTDVFTVTGGGAMHLNDALGHHPGLRCTYQHHEQACAMSAEAYARIHNQMAAVCVTSGPGATNAITGVLGAWMESIPMLVLSGQVRYATTVRASGLAIRSMGIQEYDIVKSVEPMTKYAVMVTEPQKVRYHLERALYLAANGRPGPVWLDIPLDVQGAMVKVEELEGYDPAEDSMQLPEPVSEDVLRIVLERVKHALRPVLFLGNGLRLAEKPGVQCQREELISRLGIPVITGMSSVDLIEEEHPLYVGRSGATGSRPGNFALQNSDVFLSIGSRQSFLQTGFQYQTWARAAYTIMNDLDEQELKKPNLHVNLPVIADAAEFVNGLNELLEKEGYTKEHPLFGNEEWISQCAQWKKEYPVVNSRHYETAEEGKTNIYAFYHSLSKCMPEGAPLVVSVGTSRVAGSQAFQIKKGQRFITNSATASMGYGLPAAIGVCRAGNYERVACVTGEGSLQMNLQELQTMIQNRLPVTIFVINNEGYHSIRQTQNSYFGEPLVGVGPESQDLSFPELSKLAPAYGFTYYSIRESGKLETVIRQALKQSEPVICEVFVTTTQKTEPKMASRRLEDGSMFSAPLEDMAPFLDREELRKNMYIPLVDK